MDGLTKFTGNYHRHAAYDYDGNGDGLYHVIFKIHPQTIPDAGWASSISLLVDGELVNGVSYDVFYEEGAPALGLVLPYKVVQEGAILSSQITTRKLITIPKGTPIEKGFLDRDITFSVQGSSITEIVAPVAELHTSIWGTGGDKNTLRFQTYPKDKLPFSQYFSFASQGVYVDGVQQPNVQIVKYGGDDTLTVYQVEPKNVVTGSVVVVKGSIQNTKYNVTFMELSAKWDGSKWVEWFEKTTTLVRLKADTRNASPSAGNRIYIRASEDPMLKGTYAPSDFDNGGIIYKDNQRVNVNFVKQSGGMYYMDISANPGEIIKVSGTYPLSRKRQVKFNDIYFIKNTDGSWSEYSPAATAIPDKTVNLAEVYVNLDKDGGYDPNFAPLITGETSTTTVNGANTSNKITTPGQWSVSRRIGNASKIKAVGPTFGDIIYNQTVVTYKTGDANNNGVVDVKDLVNECKKISSSSFMRGRDDLNYDDNVTADDVNLLMDMVTKAKSVADIYNKDNSLNIGSMSDTHYQESGRDGQTRINTIKALNYYKSQNVDVLIMNGDVVDLGHVNEYQALVTDIKKVYSDPTTYPKFIITGDNHEWYDAWTVNGHVPSNTFPGTQQVFIEQLSSLRDGLSDTNTYYVENGYHFIGISSDSMPPGSGQCTYDASTISFAKEKLDLAYAADPNRPIFLAIHQAPPNTVALSDNGADCFDSADMDGLLKNYPNLIVTTGHTHVPLQNENSIHQAYYTTVQSGSTHYAGGVSGNNRMNNYQGTKADGTVYDGGDQMSEKYEFSQGLILRVKGNVVDIERRDFYNDEKIRNNWVVTARENTKYPKMVLETDRGGSGDQVVITETGSSVSWVSNTEARIKLAMISESTYVDRYVVSVVENGVTIRTIEYSGLAYLGLNNSRYKSPILPITGLDAWKKYVFYVTAIDPYGNGTANGSKTFTLNPM